MLDEDHLLADLQPIFRHIFFNLFSLTQTRPRNESWDSNFLALLQVFISDVTHLL